MENHRKAEKDAKTVRKSFRFLLTKAAPCAIIRLLRSEDHGNDGTSTREKASTESAVDTLKDTRCFPGEDHSRAACDEQVVRPATEGTSAEYAERVKRQGGTVPPENVPGIAPLKARLPARMGRCFAAYGRGRFRGVFCFHRNICFQKIIDTDPLSGSRRNL